MIFILCCFQHIHICTEQKIQWEYFIHSDLGRVISYFFEQWIYTRFCQPFKTTLLKAIEWLVVQHSCFAVSWPGACFFGFVCFAFTSPAWILHKFSDSWNYLACQCKKQKHAAEYLRQNSGCIKINLVPALDFKLKFAAVRHTFLSATFSKKAVHSLLRKPLDCFFFLLWFLLCPLDLFNHPSAYYTHHLLLCAAFGLHYCLLLSSGFTYLPNDSLYSFNKLFKNATKKILCYREKVFLA